MVSSVTGSFVLAFLTPKLCDQKVWPCLRMAMERPGTSACFISLGMFDCNRAMAGSADVAESEGEPLPEFCAARKVGRKTITAAKRIEWKRGFIGWLRSGLVLDRDMKHTG